MAECVGVACILVWVLVCASCRIRHAQFRLLGRQVSDVHGGVHLLLVLLLCGLRLLEKIIRRQVVGRSLGHGLLATRQSALGDGRLAHKLVLRVLIGTRLRVCARLRSGRLVQLPMWHIEEVVHDEGRVSALKVVLRGSLLRRHVKILNFVDENWRDFVNKPITSGRRRNYSLIQVQLHELLLITLEST